MPGIDRLLDGLWEVGEDRAYDRSVLVPGLATDPRRANDKPLWCRRQVDLPGGDWTAATLSLQGARFCPAVHVNGRLLSQTPGGMAPTDHLLQDADIRPGERIDLEIRLLGLGEVPPDDASRIPRADLWRSNISSCLWDSVRLRLHGPARLLRVVPEGDWARQRVGVRWWAQRLGEEAGELSLLVEVLDERGLVLLAQVIEGADESGLAYLPMPASCQPWSPEEPHLYRLRVSLLGTGPRRLDSVTMPLGFRNFGVEGKGFRLNDQPVRLRAGSVVWHRWVRDVEAERLAWDVDWFQKNIVIRLKSHGANTLRFHLGMPPESFLDLCDRHGLMVQAEWLFFHGIGASGDSMRRQWRHWLDLCHRHPCVVLIHPWNETEGDELARAFDAVQDVARDYPPMVVAHRDVIHVHKYWWSMFENVGLYYDSAEQFPQPIVVDEFGGNYLDGDMNPGGYPALRGAFLRFLGRDHTPEMRLWLHTVSNAKIAEYWRRLGAAGYSPFCILGSPEDGNHHFLGPLVEANPKPVWASLTAAYSPRSVSLEVWDRNFQPGQEVRLGLYLFNDLPHPARLHATVCITAHRGGDEPIDRQLVSQTVPPFGVKVEQVTLRLPTAEGSWRFEALLDDSPHGVAHPVFSRWRFRTRTLKVPPRLAGRTVGLCACEPELTALMESAGLATCPATSGDADVVVTSRACWESLTGGGCDGEALEQALDAGIGVVMLDVGPRELGQGYLEGGDLGPLQGMMQVEGPEAVQHALFKGLTLRFAPLPEPESHIHPAADDASLWWRLHREETWLWNGLRGGLIVPARDMEVSGLSAEALLSTWVARGADPDAIRQGHCLAYELAGFYAFADGRDPSRVQELREHVRLIVQDAPALAGAINPEAAIREQDVSRLYRESAAAEATELTPLAVAGKDLVRTPVVRVRFAPQQGRLLISQLLTAGRLAPGFGSAGLYGLRPDPAAAQMVLNCLAAVLDEQ